MLLHDMEPQECRDLLTGIGIGHLACCKNNQPYSVPIYFAFDNDVLYGFSTMGKKIEWMRDNPRVCVEVEQVRAQNYWESVVIFGRYEELPDRPEFEEQRKQAQAVLEKRALWWQTGYAASQSRVEPKPPAPVFYCIHIDEMTGHKVRPDAIEATFKYTRSTVSRELQ